MSLPVLLTFVRLFSAYSAHDYWASSETHCKCITNDMCMNVITCNITKITTSYVGNNDPTSWTYGTAESNTVSKSYISEPIEPFCHHKGTESLSNLALHEIYHPLSNMCKDYHCPTSCKDWTRMGGQLSFISGNIKIYIYHDKFAYFS
eukprot:116187_1